jgi:hypothetical protein
MFIKENVPSLKYHAVNAFWTVSIVTYPGFA